MESIPHAEKQFPKELDGLHRQRNRNIMYMQSNTEITVSER